MANPADTLTAAKPGFTTPDPKIIKEDLGAGQDYAVRVQELKASFKGNVCDDNVKVRLDVWGMKKDGTRQVNAVAMCYTQTAPRLPPDHPPVQTFSGAKCHVLSQPQQIDWTTTEIKPVIEAHLGDRIVLEYSRPMRNFTADDDDGFRFYDGTGTLSYPTTNGRESVSVRRGARQLYADGPTQDQRPDHGRQQGLRLLDGRQHGQSRNRHEPLVQRHGRAM